MDGKYMRSVKHILFIVPGFAANENDDIAVPYLQDLLLGFNDHYKEIKISVLSLQYPYNKSEYTWNRYNVYALGGKNRRWLSKLFTLNSAYKKFKKIHQDNKVDIVHSFWLGECTLLGDRINKHYNIPHIANAMGQDVLPSNKYLKYLNPKRHQTLIYLSEFQKNNSVYKHNHSEIISFGLYPYQKLENNWDKREIDILGVGSLIKVKQYDTFIEIVNELIQKKLINKVAIIGGGPLQKDLQEKIERMSLQNNITLLGEKSRKEVFHYMNNSRIFLHTSSFEGTGYVYLEALYFNMKIVSLKSGIAKNLNEWKVCENTSELVNACESFLFSKKNTYNHLPYTVETCINSYLKLYEKYL